MIAVFPVLSGCATALNIQNDRQIYGGVRTDAIVGPYGLAKGIGFVMIENHEKFSPSTNAMLGACALADLPFSAVADTLTLPVTVPAALGWYAEKGPDQFEVAPCEALYPPEN
ncbi:MAG: YceK/YidQ family lipoprotein [Planctomycetes bacterium]|nr:YceK/YidQ family lipoprotein [Planctomycetota bacterium]